MAPKSDQDVIPQEFRHIERLEKPFPLRQMVGAASKLLEGAGASGES